VAAVIDMLMPGDSLTLMPGTYDGVDLDLLHANMTGVAGTAAAHITITGMPDGMGNLPTIVADTSNFQEAMRLRPGCAYLDVSNLHLTHKGDNTQAGIFVDSGVHDITVKYCIIDHVTGIGIQLQTESDVHDFLIEHNAIYDTADGNNGGQAFTAGGFDATTATTNVYHLPSRPRASTGRWRSARGRCSRGSPSASTRGSGCSTSVTPRASRRWTPSSTNEMCVSSATTSSMTTSGRRATA
jgi:hypothetical protein